MLIKAVLAPLVIANIGLDGFGVWNLLVSVTNYPRLGIGGINAAFQKYVSDSTGTGDYAQASRLLTTGSVLVFVVTSVVSVPFLLYTDFIVGFLNVPTGYVSPFSTAIRFLIIVIIISNSTTAFSAIIAGAHRLELTAKIGMFWRIVESIFTVALLFKGYRLFALALPFAVSQLGRVFSSIYFAQIVLPEVSLHPRYFSAKVVKDLVKFAGSFHLLGMLEMLYATLVPALIMRYFGASISGVYAAATRLIAVSSLAAESLMLPLLSGSAYIFSKGDQARNKFLFTYSFKFVVFTALPLFLFMSFYSDQILFAWTGERNDLFMPSMFLLAASGLCTVLGRHHMIMYRSSGQKIYDIIWMVIRFSGLLVFGILLKPFYGYLGLLSGPLIGDALGLFFMMYVMYKLFNTDYIDFLRNSYVKIAAVIVFIYLEWYVSVAGKFFWKIGYLCSLFWHFYSAFTHSSLPSFFGLERAFKKKRWFGR